MIYAATSSVHDMYQSTHLTDKSIDSGDGLVLATADGGSSWSTIFDFKMPVIWVVQDRKRSGRLYAAAIHSTKGGIFVADGVAGVRTAAFKKLSNPPRTQGHPYTVVSLPDGALVVSYSGRMDDQRRTFYNSSGVFYLPAAATCLANPTVPCHWEDRSSVEMSYWTKELVVDPLDPSGDTWFACVFTDWGATRHDGAPARGGLYRTSDRGKTWTGRIDGVPHDGDDMDQARIDSVTIVKMPGAVKADLYMTTEGAGLWHSPYDPSLKNYGLNFAQQVGYPFSHPTRVVQNPFNVSELWVTSFGNGLYVGLAM